MKRTQSVKKCFRGGTGEKIGGGGGVRERSWGTKASGGKEGKGCQPGGKDLCEEKGRRSQGGKGLRRKRGEINDLNRELGGKDLREERQKIWRKKGLGGERGEMISTGKGVENILGRKREDLVKKGQQGEVGKDLRKEKGEALRKERP